MKRRILTSALVSALAISLVPGAAFAHVVVTPSSAGIGTHVTFNVSVANEKDTEVTDLKLIIPSGLSDVTPTTKDGWTITTNKTGDTVSQIEWANGHIPVGQRQDFTFSAQTPAQPGDIDWKAYQTYANGTVVKWDQTPTDDSAEGENVGPYSVTKVADDLTTPVSTSQAPNATLSIVLSIVAVVLSAGSLLIRRRK